ncbi:MULTISPECIES: FecR domain-containing protein [unclassified Sphingomonas]|jgi:transmembrane sensor|uniref:FecR family protein n=1 Tax=unclassified Sphingomonas TaxID=196159 RepID=UPI000A55D3E7|nr:MULTISPECIES: FecR domain-containing protein [unclassified Sphingomonas]
MGDEAFDEAAFDAWLAGDPRCRPAYDTMWRRIMGSDMDAALQAYGRPGRSGHAWLVGGMTVLLVMLGGYKSLPLIALYLAQPQDYSVADGKVRAVTLADGTQLTLGGSARVKIRYTRHDRVVELTQGTLFAKVAHDAQRPFRIDTGNARIVDVGTSFEVSNKPGSIRVAVASGVVRFGRNGWFDTPIQLQARQAAILDQAGLNRIADMKPDEVARWRGEWMEYRGAPLRQVIADLQSLSPLPIDIADKDLAEKPVSGRIRLTDPVGQLENLSITHAFRVHKTERALTLSKS